jgi:hypothetical protein
MCNGPIPTRKDFLDWAGPAQRRPKRNVPECHDRAKEKVQSPQLWRASVFPLQTIKSKIFPPPTLKTVRFTSLTGFGRWVCYGNCGFATVTDVLSFFISAETLKNHSKSQKNRKIENLILLDST